MVEWCAGSRRVRAPASRPVTRLLRRRRAAERDHARTRCRRPRGLASASSGLPLRRGGAPRPSASRKTGPAVAPLCPGGVPPRLRASASLSGHECWPQGQLLWTVPRPHSYKSAQRVSFADRSAADDRGIQPPPAARGQRATVTGVRLSAVVCVYLPRRLVLFGALNGAARRAAVCSQPKHWSGWLPAMTLPVWVSSGPER
jgi:hypothetical protein